MDVNPTPARQGGPSAEGASNKLNTYIVTDPDGFKRLRPAWRALQSAADGGNPFTQWAWAWHWWRLFGGGSALVSHELRIIVMQEADVVRAIFPFVLTTVGKAPFRVCKLHLYGFTGGFTELRGPLIWPGWEEEAAAVFINMLHHDRHLYQWCALDGIPANTALGKWLSARAEEENWTHDRDVLDYVLRLPPTWEALRAGLKRNIKQSLRHCYNSLKRGGHDWTFRLITQPQEIPAALEEFLRLHSLRASMPGTIHHPDYFSTARRRLFLNRVARELSSRQRFMIAQLVIDGNIVASRIVLATDSGIYLYYSGFDPAWKHYSVMTTLTAECIKAAIQQGYRSVNFSTGTDFSKTRWGPEAIPYFGLKIPSPTLKGRTLFALRERLPVRKIVLPETQSPEQPQGDSGK